MGLCATGATELLHYILLWHLHTCNGAITNGNDTVTGHYASFLRGASCDGLYYHQCVVQNIELYAYAVKGALQRFVQTICLLGCTVCGMRVQFLYHSTDSIFYEFFCINGIYIVVVDGDGGDNEFSYLLVHALLRFGRQET